MSRSNDTAMRAAHLMDVCETILTVRRPSVMPWATCRLCGTSYPDGAGSPDRPVNEDGVCAVCAFCGPPEQAQ